MLDVAQRVTADYERPAVTSIAYISLHTQYAGSIVDFLSPRYIICWKWSGRRTAVSTSGDCVLPLLFDSLHVIKFTAVYVFYIVFLNVAQNHAVLLFG
jgi:hypothetical protein